MAKIISKQLVGYESDIDAKIYDVTFKIREDKAGIFAYTDPPAVSCGGAPLIPRKAVGVYKDGSVVEFPIISPVLIPQTIRDVLASTDCVCVHLIGEKWKFIPNSLISFTATTTAYTLPDKADKITGSADYNGDIFNSRIKFSIEKDPTAISDAAKGCLQDIKEDITCVQVPPNYKPRHGIVTAVRDTGSATRQSKIVRKALISNPVDVKTCLENLASKGLCIGYEGESLRNAHLYV